MKVTADTNVLVRAVVGDDPVQALIATRILIDAEFIAVALPCLCEFVWVLLRVYHFQPSDAARAIRALLAAPNVEANRPAAEAGLAVFEAGGGILPMASLPMKVAGSAGKPSFLLIEGRSNFLEPKGTQHDSCEDGS